MSFLPLTSSLSLPLQQLGHADRLTDRWTPLVRFIPHDTDHDTMVAALVTRALLPSALPFSPIALVAAPRHGPARTRARHRSPPYAADARHEALQGPCVRAVLCRCEEGRRGGAVPPREAAVRRPPRPHARPAAWPPPWPGRRAPPWPPSPAAAIATREGHQRGRNEGVQARRATAAAVLVGRPEPLQTPGGPSAAPLLALPGRPPLRLASRSAAAERRRGPSAAGREKAPSRRAGGARRRGRSEGRRGAPRAEEARPAERPQVGEDATPWWPPSARPSRAADGRARHGRRLRGVSYHRWEMNLMSGVHCQ
ncbi:hypothetical protein PVAP13_5KG439007 [Panicum virgatum]|uniref:Uncharacterized protein n=1 Tax=Panicum virgatum TaxID=38727 RepID=A0A8T0SWT2_PANVG|nr:hypothetical protein PVAP13_5KG439007 [Panicum virgatum]